MLEEICKALSEETNIRENLIELKKSIKNQDALKEWKEYHAKHPVLYAFLSSEDAKIRKNAALILGETNESGAAKALFEAYQKEGTRFVKSAYLTAMNGLDIEDYQNALEERYQELLAEVPAENEKKHRTEELHALDKLLGGQNQNKKHRFTGYEEEVEVLLTTNPAYREITAEQIKKDRPVLVPAGVKVKTTHLRDVIKIRTFREMLLMLSGGHRIVAEPEAVAEAFAKSNLMELLNRLHEGNPPFRFRMEVRGIAPEEKGSFIRKAAAALEDLTGHQLLNTVDGYEIELRLTKNADGTLYPSCKLFTIPMRRFSYRKESIAASIHPANAALFMKLAEPYLKKGAQVLDPCCGVGTMLIERDLLVPAGDMYGLDIFGEAVIKARENAKAAGRQINYINRNFFDFTHKYLFDEIITNMPLRGKKTREEQDAFYSQFFDCAGKFLKNGGHMILYSNEGGFVKKQLRRHTEYRLIDEFCIREKEGFYLFIVGKKG